MASEFAHPPQQSNGISQPDSGIAPDAPSLPSVHASSIEAMQHEQSVDTSSFASTKPDFASTDASQPLEPASDALDTSSTDPPAPSAPIEGVSAGIQPLADFVPKDASTLSHPTPPPDEAVVTDGTDGQVVRAGPESEPPIVPPADEKLRSVPVLPEQSLVRPREDDVEDAPVAKRSRFDDDSAALPALGGPADEPFSDYVVVDRETLSGSGDLSRPQYEEPAPTETSLDVAAENSAIESTAEDILPVQPSVSETLPTTSFAEAPGPAERSFVEPVAEQQSLDQPSIPEQPAHDSSVPVLPTTEPSASVPTVPEPSLGDVNPESASADVEMADASSDSIKVEAPALSTTEPVKAEQPPAELATTPIAPSSTDAPISSSAPPPSAPTGPSNLSYSTEPMTTAQRAWLMEKTKNLKKTKHSIAFLRPVDHVALNIPNYPETIKNPMDLGTLEKKLKDGQHVSVQDYAEDFNLIVGNCRRFNGDAHPITQAAFAMDAYFRKVMEYVPSADAPAPAKILKKRSPSLQREAKPRRESRVIPQPQPGATSPTEVYALQSDGTPQIRRHSSNVRPARAIKPPQNKEIPYAKPKRKEHMLELKFCEHVLDDIRGAKYGTINHVFLQPVDPVALNIPNYRQVIKNPMDLGSMSQKIKTGQYATAHEFKKDFDLIVKNCLAFNPIGNPVRDMGIQLQREFETLWAGKDKWERKNQPASNRASSVSGDDESAAEEEEEEEEEEEDEKTATIRALQKQLAEMQKSLSAVADDKPSKPKKSKSSKPGGGSSKKLGSLSSVPAKSSSKHSSTKPSSKTKKPRQVTYDEKQEISDAVSKMDDKQVAGLTDIITKNCAKYRDMEEMELEIDDLPNDVQLMLLDYVRRLFGRPNKAKKLSSSALPSRSHQHQQREVSPDDLAAEDDDDFEPGHKGRGGAGGKRKKHKPMGKSEQLDAITSIKSQLAQFSHPGASGSESPTDGFGGMRAAEETSGDEESEESEEE